jgi:restriction system protein
VINLIRNFLISSGTLGADKHSFEYLLGCDKETHNRLMKIEYYRRLLRGYIKGQVWEGNTWIIDLLPHWPKVALDALNAYFLAHCQFLPDGRIDGLSDAMALIRARFIQTPRSALLSSLEPYQFEHLIDKLYSEMGYSTTLTQKTRDGGRDVIAEKSGAAKREKLLIECKTLKRNIGVQPVRSLLGIVSDEKATKGVFVCTSTFTRDARKLERRNPRLDLIDNTDLQVLLNEHLGPTWPEHVDSLISRSMVRAKKSTALQNPAP